MVKISVETGGRIAIPPAYGERFGLSEGKGLILEGLEDGLALRLAVPECAKGLPRGHHPLQPPLCHLCA
jgi:bifunctional DNA-binding transcriptional regulator/antitoxin component of YhaV-PrlF toxin-antitoxin module